MEEGVPYGQYKGNSEYHGNDKKKSGLCNEDGDWARFSEKPGSLQPGLRQSHVLALLNKNIWLDQIKLAVSANSHFLLQTPPPKSLLRVPYAPRAAKFTGRKNHVFENRFVLLVGKNNTFSF